MRIYLAGPMSGLPELNYPAFADAASQLRQLGAFVCNPAELSQPDSPTNTYRNCLAVDLAWIIGHAEMIVVLPGFEKSPGANVEIALALALKLPIMLLADAVAELRTQREKTIADRQWTSEELAAMTAKATGLHINDLDHEKVGTDL